MCISPFPRSRPILRRTLAACAAAALCCSAQEEKTLFTALETTPEAVGLALARATGTVSPRSGRWQNDLQPDPFALSAFPSSAAEREALLEVLSRKHEFSNLPRQREFAAMLLEGWDRAKDALDLLEKDPSGIDLLHLTRLRYRNDDKEGAATAFTAAKKHLGGWSCPYPSLPSKTVVLARPFEALGQLEALADFLTWLQPQCDSAELACEILHLRLNTAYHRGSLDELLTRLADEPPPLRHLARWSLTGDPAVLPADIDALSPAVLLQFHRVSPTAPVMIRLMEAQVREGRGNPDERVAVLRYLLTEPSMENQRLLALWLEQDESALAVLAAALPQLLNSNRLAGFAKTIPALQALAGRHPEHAAANLLVGRVPPDPSTRRSQGSGGGPEPVPHLLRVLGHPLLSDAADQGLSTAALLQSQRPDFPGMALETLSTLLPPPELMEKLEHHPDFAKLPAMDQARYLALAKLDVPFTEALLRLDWSQAANDPFGGWPAAYLAPIRQLRQPAGELLARLRAALPAILAGSGEKSPALIVQHAETTRALFPDDDEFKTLLAELGGRLDGDAKKRIDDLAGALPPRASVVRPTLPPEEPAAALPFFSPPRLVRWLDYGFPPQGLPGTASHPASYLRNQVLLERFPVPSAGQLMLQWVPAEIRKQLWLLRPLLPPDSLHATAVDLLITTPIPNSVLAAPPDELAETAAAHLEAWCPPPHDPDFLIYQEIAAQPQNEPVNWSFLAKLEKAPFGIRKQAAAILESAAARGGDTESEALRKLLLGEAVQALPPPDEPERRREREPAHPAEKAARLALADADPEAFLTALEAFPKDDFSNMARVVFDPQCTRVVPQADAARLLRALAIRAETASERTARDSSPIPGVTDDRISDCHRFFLGEDPALAKQLRHVLLTSGHFQTRDTLRAFVRSLIEQGDRTGAVDLLAAAACGLGSARPLAPGLRFPAAPPSPFALTPGGLAAFAGAVETSLCQETLERLTANPAHPVPEDLAALLRYGARPTLETFRDEVLALANRQPAHLRDSSRSNLFSVATIVPRALEHLLMTAESTTEKDGFPAWRVALDSVDRYPGEWNADILRSVWHRLKDTGEKEKPPHALVAALAPVMLDFADDALWDEFFPAFTSHPAFRMPDDLPSRFLLALAFASRRERAVAVLRALPVDETRKNLRSLARVAWLLEDGTTLDAIRKRIGNLPDARELEPIAQDLCPPAERVEQAVPAFHLTREADGKLFLNWTMTDGAPQIPAEPLAVPGDAFDLSITRVLQGRPEPEPIQLKSIPARGSLELPAMPGGTGNDVVLVKTTRREDGIELGDSSVEPPHPRSVTIPLERPASVAAPRVLAAPFEHMPPPCGLLLTTKEAVKLADLPWTPGQALTLNGWAVNLGDARIEIRAFDADGALITTQPLYLGSARGIAAWQSFSTHCASPEILIAERLELYATTASSSHDASIPALWLADLRIHATNSRLSPPAAASPVGRVPRVPAAMTCSPDGDFLAIGLEGGRVLIMDAATGATGGFSLPRTTHIVALAMGGKRVIAVNHEGVVFLMDLETGAVRSLGQPGARPTPIETLKIDLSPDGQWLVWTDHQNHLRIVKVEDQRLGRALVLPVGERPRYTIDHWGGAVIAWGSAGHFVIPFAALETLDPANLDPLPDFPTPRCAYRAYLGGKTPVCGWHIPRHALVLGGISRNDDRWLGMDVMGFPCPPTGMAVSADGTVFFVTPDGMLHCLNCADITRR